MTSRQRLSQLYRKTLLRQYENGSYTVEEAILETENLYSRRRLTEQDYNELTEYFESELDRIIAEEETVEDMENNAEENNIINP